MSRAEQEDLRNRGRSPPHRRRVPRALRLANPITRENIDLMRLAETIRSQIPVDRTPAERVNRGGMSDIADRLHSMANNERFPGIALEEDDWCRIEGWGFVRRVRHRDGGFVFEQAVPASGAVPPGALFPLDNFALPPSVADAATPRPPEGSPERVADDLRVITQQVQEEGGAALSHEHVYRVYLLNDRDVVNTIFQLQDEAVAIEGERNARLRELESRFPVAGTPHPLPQERHVRELTEALSGLLSATGGARSIVDGAEWPLLESRHREGGHYAIEIGGMITHLRPEPPNDMTEIPSPTDVPPPTKERSVSTLHLLVCEFIDEWDLNPSRAHEAAPREFFCPISHAAMRRPVCAGDGHLYDRPMIEKAFRCSRLGYGGSVISPMTRETLRDPEHTRLFPCLALLALMERWVCQHVEVADGATLESTLKERTAEVLLGV